MRKGFQEWLSPADPTINYNTARDTYHDGTAAWFTQSETLARWKEPGSESLLWIHGKRIFLLLLSPWLSLILHSGLTAGSGKSIIRCAAARLVVYVYQAAQIFNQLRNYPPSEKCS